MFNDTKYTKWYRSIIYNRRVNTYSGYTEKHHIIPESLGGSNDDDNLVRLTAREHFICHLLLTKMLEGEAKAKMVFAAHNMLHWRKSNAPKIGSRTYQSLKEAFSKAQKGKLVSEETRQKISGAGNGMYGKTHSKEAKQKISESSSRRRHTQTTKEHMSLIRQGAQTQEWIVLTPEKLEIHVSNLKLFCKENNIKYHTLYSSLGKSEISRGAGKGYKLMRSPNISLAY